MANVYVFNLYNEPITGLSVSGYAAGNIPGFATGSSPPPYTPASLAVPRSKSPGSGPSFAIGDNAVIVPWDSFRGQVTVTIPDPATSRVSLDDPLILYLTSNDAVLMTARGYVLDQFPIELTQVVRPGTSIASSPRPLEAVDVEPLLGSLRPWLSSPSINRLSVGTKIVDGHDTGRVCVTVGVDRKVPLWELGVNDFPVPRSVELHLQEADGGIVAVDVPTDVVEIGVISTVGLTDRVRPTPGGYQIAVSAGWITESTGTLGANIVFHGRFRLVTNNHVISNNGNVGGTVYQPEEALWGNSLTKVEGFQPVITYPNRNEPNPTYNRFDLAWAAIDPAEGATNITGIGQPTGIRNPVVGEAVRWIGKTTGTVQRTTIASITDQTVVDFGSSGKQWAWFQQVIRFNGGSVAAGDSGSAVVATSDMNIVGLIFAGDAAGAGYACRIL